MKKDILVDIIYDDKYRRLRNFIVNSNYNIVMQVMPKTFSLVDYLVVKRVVQQNKKFMRDK